MSAEHSTVSPCVDQTLPGYRDSEWLQNHRAKLIPLYRGRKSQKRVIAYTVVDESDYEALSQHQWSLSLSRGVRYARRTVARKGSTCKSITVHQVVSGIMGADHRNRDGLDNRRSNIRPATYQQNIANQGLRRTSKTGYRGVRYVARDELFQARLVTGKKEVSLGYFANKHEAAFAYNCASHIVFHEFAFMNRLSECDVPDAARREAIHAYVVDQIVRRGVTRI